MNLLRSARQWIGAALFTLFLAGCSGSDDAAPPETAPVITSQPASVTVSAGSPATFTVVASGSGSVSYQWQRNGTAIAGATGPSYTLASPAVADSGASFNVVVSNGVGPTPSSTATLTVTPPPVAPSISSQPVGTTVASGTAATFSVVAAGTAPISYQWQREGVNIAGATTATYTLASATPADTGTSFRVIVSNAAGSVTSTAVQLSVVDTVTPPTLLAQPQSANTLDGSTAQVSVSAGGTPPFSYQWRRNGTAIAGATAATYTTPALTLADSGAAFTVVVSNSAGSVTSNAATITVNPQLVALTAQPASASVPAGQPATFSVTATGSAPISYQWRRNGTAIAGATGASYTTPATSIADSGALFTVLVSNAANSVTSATATLTVSAAAVAPTIATAPASLTVSEGQTASFSVSAAGTAPLTYQWRRNAVDIAGATSASYTTGATTLAADNAARYSVRVSNAAGSVTSADAVLTVTAATGGLVGRAWTTGRSLEPGANTVETFRSGLDDAGNAVVVYAQDNGTRMTLYAVHGAPGGPGQAPSWTSPVVIDTAGTTSYTLATCVLCETPYVSVAPNGNAAAVWPSNVACTATTYRTSGTCQTLFVATYDAASRTWSAPTRAVDTPTNSFGGSSQVRFNNRGDVAFLYLGWVRSGTTNFSPELAVAWRAAGQSNFQNRVFNLTSANFDFDMDDAGNMTVAGSVAQNATFDFVAYRGNVSSGFGAQEIIDARSSAASGGIGLRVGRNGQIVTFYTQNNGTSERLFAATAASASAPFTITDLAQASSVANVRTAALDNGTAVLHYACNAYTWSGAGGAWSGPRTLPGNCQTSGIDLARNGDSLLLLAGSGLWSTYAAATNTMVQPLPASSTGQPASAFVYGVASSLRRSLNGRQEWSLSPSGVALFVSSDAYDVLPAPGAPNGDGRPSILNLWGVYLK